MTKKQLIKEFKKAVEHMRRTHDNGTYYWYLHTDENNNDWAIVLGWADGFEAKETDDCMDGTWRLCTKLAYQPHNSIMQCDYDVDWTMPYDEDTMEVNDNEISIYPNYNAEEIIDWLLKCYSNYM